MSLAVELFVDPICPFAWLTSRWLAAVEGVRPVTVRYRVMSLSVLNDGRDGLSDFYRDLVDRGWGPARLAIAVEANGGPDALRAFYEAFGSRRHLADEPLGEELNVASLTDAGLPAALAAAATTSDHDGALRASHEHGMRPVGDDVGTPVVHLHRDEGPPLAIFGPVVNPSPRGEAAGRIWDAVVELASAPEFLELKRSRRGPLVFA
jgi:hypothetical protein